MKKTKLGILKKSISVIFLFELFLPAIPFALAYELTGYYWSSGDIDPLYYYDDTKYNTPLDDAVDDWNDEQNEVTLSEGTGLNSNVWVYDVDLSQFEWYAVTEYTYYSGYVLDTVNVKLNEPNLDPLATGYITSTVTHEFGHVMGLDEENDLSVVMHQDPIWRGFHGCLTVQDDDVDGIEDIY